MERCDLTQVPCRKAIAEIVKANKNKKSLQLTYEVAKLFQMVMSEENSTLNSVDFKRFFLIEKLFMIESLKDFEYIDSFVNGLMKWGIGSYGLQERNYWDGGKNRKRSLVKNNIRIY